MTRPLLVLGLDGLDADVLRTLDTQQPLPHLARLLDPTMSQPMRPGEERYTGLAWEQFSSGKDAASGGRTSAVCFDPDTYRVTQPTTRLAPFTATLDARVVAFDVPYFDLAAGNACGLARWGAHDPGVPRHAHPASLDAEMEARFGQYPAEPWIYGFVWPDPEATRQMGDALLRAVEMRTELTSWLLTQRLPDWDLALTVVAELHSATEALWHGFDPSHPLHDHPSAVIAREALGAIYAAADRFVGQIADACPHADVLAFTCHGMGRNNADVPAMLLLPELLYRSETGHRAFEAPSTWQARGGGPAHWPAGADWSQLVLSTMTPPRVARRSRWSTRLERVDCLSYDVPMHWMPATHYQNAWPAMRAFALPSFYDSRVRLNLKGREAHGRIPARKARAMLNELRALLAETIDLETGRPVEVELLSPLDGTASPQAAADADLIVRWLGQTTGLQHPKCGVIGPAPWRRTGGHTGGDGRVATIGASSLALPNDLDSPATLSQWLCTTR